MGKIWEGFGWGFDLSNQPEQGEQAVQYAKQGQGRLSEKTGEVDPPDLVVKGFAPSEGKGWQMSQHDSVVMGASSQGGLTLLCREV